VNEKLLGRFGVTDPSESPSHRARRSEVRVVWGYSYYRLHKSTFFDRLGNNSSGWNGAATLNVTSWLGMVADVGALYSPKETTSDRQQSVTSSVDTYRVLFGPRFTLRGNNKLVPFIQPLVGVAHSKRDAFGTAEGQPFSESISKTGLALAAGAGLDVRAGDRLSNRPRKKGGRRDLTLSGVRSLPRGTQTFRWIPSA
jgi:Outer membrane protein beta-barrel domain